MSNKLQLCFTDILLSLEVVNNLFQDPSPVSARNLREQMGRLRNQKVVKELYVLLPVSP